MLAVLHAAADAIAAALAAAPDRGLAGTRPGQHHSDLAADAAALAVLGGAGFGVLSEESGAAAARAATCVVVVDPLDGSTNAARGIPWYATSLCARRRGRARSPPLVVEPRARRALRGDARRRGAPRRRADRRRPVPPSLAPFGVGLSGYPPRSLGWGQYRALGAAALDLCAVADGRARRLRRLQPRRPRLVGLPRRRSWCAARRAPSSSTPTAASS